MTNYYVTYHFDSQSSRDAFYAEIKSQKLDELIRAEDGCIRYEYFYPADTDNQIFLWEQWVSKDAQKAHMNQPHMVPLMALKEKYNASTQFFAQDAAK